MGSNSIRLPRSAGPSPWSNQRARKQSEKSEERRAITQRTGSSCSSSNSNTVQFFPYFFILFWSIISQRPSLSQFPRRPSIVAFRWWGLAGR